ncbi:MAG: hypothetical protein WBI17_07575 [Clostridiaceae bacterium]
MYKKSRYEGEKSSKILYIVVIAIICILLYLNILVNGNRGLMEIVRILTAFAFGVGASILVDHSERVFEIRKSNLIFFVVLTIVIVMLWIPTVFLLYGIWPTNLVYPEIVRVLQDSSVLKGSAFTVLGYIFVSVFRKK